MDGVLNVNKPAGPTSHDIVDMVRRLAGQKRVGHTGTLDPMATGVLVVCLGRATRIVEYLVGAEKAYRARMVLGVSTDTQDSCGEVLSVKDASDIRREDVEQAAARFVGEIRQVPPMVSAVRQNGRRLYELAREGRTVERTARTVVVHAIEVTAFTGGTAAEAELNVCCGSGTYIRTLCADIGEALGCGAHMSMLQRTRVGHFKLEDSVSVEELELSAASGMLSEKLLSLNEALGDMNAVTVYDESVWNVCHGTAVEIEDEGVRSGAVRLVSTDGDLLAVGTVVVRGGKVYVKPDKVLAHADR